MMMMFVFIISSSDERKMTHLEIAAFARPIVIVICDLWLLMLRISLGGEKKEQNKQMQEKAVL
jgi:hypothetical protein